MSLTNEEKQALNDALASLGENPVSRRRFLQLASLFGVSAALAACGQQPAEPTATSAPAAATATTAPVAPTATPTEAMEEAQTAGTLRVAWDTPEQLDPAFASAEVEIAILNAVYDYLVDIDVDNQIQPRLATNWEVSDDGLTYVFTLTEGAAFHDGSPFTAEDVVWTYDRLRDPALESPTVDLYANVESIEATGEHEVTFTLKETNPFFLFDLSDNHAVMLKAGTEDPATAFNGTGPFRVADYSVGNRMDLEANPDYFMDGKPKLQTLEFIFFSDQQARVEALRGGQADLVMRMPTPLYQSLEGNADLERVTVATNTFDVARLRVDREPGNDPRVVEAFKLATDRQIIFETVKLGLGTVGRDSPIGPLYSTYYTDEFPLPPRDPERARQLLADAGYPDGLQMELHVPDSGDRPDLAAVLQEQWAEAGIDVELVVEPESIYYGENKWLEVDLGITGWGSRPIPQFYLDVMVKCDAKWNEAHFCDDEIDQLIEVAGSTLDEEERIEAYHEIQRLMIERGPLIIPYFYPQLGAIRTGFAGFNMKAFPGRTDLANIQKTA